MRLLEGSSQIGWVVQSQNQICPAAMAAEGFAAKVGEADE